MREDRRAVKPLDPAATAAANAAVAAETGGRRLTSREEDEELRRKWMDAYKAAGGKTKTVKRKGRSPSEPCENCKNKRLVLKLVSLEYLSDHDLLKDHTADWTDSGTPFVPPDWTPGSSNPVSHSMDKTVKVKVIVRAEPDGQTESGRLVGKLGSEPFFASNATTFSPGQDHTLVMETSRKVIKKVRKQSIRIKWVVKTDSSYATWTNLGETENEWFTTIDRPRDSGESQHGVTLKRMRKAVELVEPMKTIKPHEIVLGLMKLLPYYVLRADPAVPSELKHPNFFNSKGGAWPIAAHMSHYAECQAIVRFVEKIIKQIGAPGDGKMVFIFADPADPDTAKEDDESTPGRKALHKHPGYALVDKPITSADIGRVYPKSHTRMPDGSTSMGFNAFEACLKFTARGDSGGDETYYYPGGTGGSRTDSAQKVLDHSFYALVKFTGAWYPNAHDPDRERGLKVVEIAKIYRTS